MKRAFVVLLLAMSFSVFAEQSSTKLPARHVDDPSDLPTISKFQTPGVVPNIGCGDTTSGEPCVDDGGGGGYIPGGCNCSRICYEGHTGCNLSVSNNGCQAGSNGNSCSSCSGKCY